MKIAMMARNPTLFSHRRLVEAAEQRGHSMDIINTLQCYMNITSHRPELRYKGEKLTGYDAVIPRIGASITYYGLAVLRQFEMMGVYPLNFSPLTDRDQMGFRMLLGRTALERRLMVDPALSFCLGKPRRDKKRRKSRPARVTLTVSEEEE